MILSIEGQEVACLSRADLIVNSRAARRPTDLVDVADLEQEQSWIRTRYPFWADRGQAKKIASATLNRIEAWGLTKASAKATR